VVRISGPRALSSVQALFDRPLPSGGRHRFGRLTAHDGAIIDDVVVAVFESPHSFTGEDVVELSCHGSPVVVAEVLDRLYLMGVRAAEAGEFTLRAYFNGRLDLTQAEAVADLISASSKESVRQASRQLQGGIGSKTEAIAKIIERLLVNTELELDFVEEDVTLLSPADKLALVDSSILLVEQMLRGYKTARRLREGVTVAITGAPNVGKSSLFNALIGDNRAIVHATAGTTRDIIAAKVILSGIEFELFDTAGLREGAGEIEDEGIRRALEMAGRADVVLSVDTEETPSPYGSGGNVLAVRNKGDLGRSTVDNTRINVSAVTGDGLARLRDSMVHCAVGDEILQEGCINRERHYILLNRALAAMRRGRESAILNLHGEMIAEEWREALRALDELTGKRRLAGLLETIFGEFCIGK